MINFIKYETPYLSTEFNNSSNYELQYSINEDNCIVIRIWKCPKITIFYPEWILHVWLIKLRSILKSNYWNDLKLGIYKAYLEKSENFLALPGFGNIKLQCNFLHLKYL